MITWKPKSLSTTPETSPGFSANAASEKGLTIRARVNSPRSPPFAAEPLSSENFFASAAKSSFFAFFAMSPASFFASSLVRTTFASTIFAPLNEMRT